MQIDSSWWNVCTSETGIGNLSTHWRGHPQTGDEMFGRWCDLHADDTTLGKAIDAIIVSNASAAVEEFETASHRILNPLLEWLDQRKRLS